MVKILSLINEAVSPKVELTSSTITQDVIDNTAKDDILYKGKPVFDIVYVANIESLDDKIKQELNEMIDLKGLFVNECYLAYSPSSDEFVMGYDGGAEVENPEYDEDNDEEPTVTDSISPFITFKINGTDVTDMVVDYWQGEWYPTNGGRDKVHTQYKDLLELRLD